MITNSFMFDTKAEGCFEMFLLPVFIDPLIGLWTVVFYTLITFFRKYFYIPMFRAIINKPLVLLGTEEVQRVFMFVMRDRWHEY